MKKLLFGSSRKEVEKIAETIDKNLKHSIDHGDRFIFLDELLADTGLPYVSDWTNSAIYLGKEENNPPQIDWSDCLAVLRIDPATKWNDYPGDKLYLWNGSVLYVATQDDVNLSLSEVDERKGYKDSWVVDMYTLDKEEKLPQGGQWMETEVISDMNYTLGGIMDRLSECDLWEDDWRILTPEMGEYLYSLFLDYDYAKFKVKDFVERTK